VHREGRVLRVEHDEHGTFIEAEVGPALAAELEEVEAPENAVGS